MSTEWDLIEIGQCFGERDENGPEVKYKSQYAKQGPVIWKGVTLDGERLIHRSREAVCTAAYAISLRGAAKLLLRTILELDQPVDLIINNMIRSGELVSYSVVQPPFVQWQYRKGLGMEGHNSVIHEGEKPVEPSDEKSWAAARKDHSIWTYAEFEGTGPLKQNALEVAWQNIFSFTSLFSNNTTNTTNTTNPS